MVRSSVVFTFLRANCMFMRYFQMTTGGEAVVDFVDAFGCIRMIGSEKTVEINFNKGVCQLSVSPLSKILVGGLKGGAPLKMRGPPILRGGPPLSMLCHMSVAKMVN